MPSKVPAISILTPVWNGLPYFKECVDSVLAQEFKDWTLIISDNGSTDGTRDYLDTLNDPRIQVFKQEKNLGINGNLNFLISKTTTPLAYYLCADDFFYPDGLGRTIKEWESVDRHTAFIGFNWKEVLKQSKVASYSYGVLPKRLDPADSQLAFFLFGNLPGNLSNVSANVELLKASGGFSENLRMAADFDIWARIAKKHTMILSDTETVSVRRHEGVASNYLNKQGQLFGEHVIIYAKLIEDLSRSSNRKDLIDYFNIVICSFHLRESLKAIVYGKLKGLKMFLSITSPIFWPRWKRLVVCLPFALHESGRERLGIRMAQKIYASRQQG